MNYTLRLQRSGRTLLLLVLLGVASAAFGQKGKPTFTPGEILLYCQPGTVQADVDALAAKVQAASVQKLALTDLYMLYLPPAKKNDQDTLAAVALLKVEPTVRWVNGNRIHYIQRAPPTIVPNDPRFADQWGPKMINMPLAWAIQKGAVDVNVAVEDSGFRPKHEDLTGRYMAGVKTVTEVGSHDFADNDDDITADGGGAVGEAEHGVHVSGIIIAQPDNGKGIAGICWENIKCVGMKIQKKGVATLDTPAIFAAYDYLAKKGKEAHIVAVNMSFGGAGNPSDINDPEYVAIKAINDAGVIVVPAAGNSAADNGSLVPAGYRFPLVVTVSSVGPSGKLSSFSSFGKVEIAAPGGDISASGIDADGILSTLGSDTGYAYEQGTSMAAPHAAGVLGLLMSVPGVTPTLAIKALEDGANRTINPLTTLPDARYGFGVLDAYQSLLKVSVRVLITAPAGVDAIGNPSDPSGVTPPVQTLKPTLSFQLDNIKPSSVVVKVDGASVITDITSTDAQSKGIIIQQNSPTEVIVSFRQQFSPGTHTIVVSGTNPGGDRTVSDTRTISVVPFRIPKGRSFLSFPYTAETNTGVALDQNQLLGSDFILYRWSQKIGKYGIFPSSSPNSNLATFSPPDSTPTPANGAIKPPLGLAFFIDTTVDKDVLTYGQSFTDQPFRIPLQPGWNMVGDPFPFAVPFNTAQIELPTGQRLSIQQAADQKLVFPSIYRFLEGEYTYRSLPDGTFNPWEGHWIYMATNTQYTGLTLVLSPTATNAGGGRAAVRLASTRAAIPTTTTTNTNAPYRPKVEGPGSWSLRLVAHAKNLTDSNNFIGMTTRATNLSRVPKPPPVGPFVSLGIVHQEAPHLYAQDLQPIGGTKTWDVVVATDQANTDVVLTWPEANTLPRNVHLLLTDRVTGKVVDVARQSSYQFNTGTTPGTRAFTLTARPAQARGRALLTNVFVNPNIVPGGRAATTYEIGYTISEDAQVEISILSASGRRIAVVGATRDVPNGNNRALWNGRDSAGRVIGSGVYAVQLRAITSDGALTRMIQPFVNTGR